MAFKDPEKARAYYRAWRAKHPEYWHADNKRRWKATKARLATDPEFAAKYKAAKAARWHKWYCEHSAVRKAHCKAYRAENRAILSDRLRRKCAANPAYFREKNRRSAAKKRILAGKTYTPRYHMRLPDWYVMGQRVLDNRSAFLAVNMTVEQNAYARELAIERKSHE